MLRVMVLYWLGLVLMRCSDAAKSSSAISEEKSNSASSAAAHNSVFFHKLCGFLMGYNVNSQQCHLAMLINDTSAVDNAIIPDFALYCEECGLQIEYCTNFFSFHALQKGATNSDTAALLKQTHLYHVACAAQKAQFVCSCGEISGLNAEQLLGYVSEDEFVTFQNFNVFVALPKASQLEFFYYFFSKICEKKTNNISHDVFFKQVNRFLDATGIEYATFWVELLATSYADCISHRAFIGALEYMSRFRKTYAKQLLERISVGPLPELLPQNKPRLYIKIPHFVVNMDMNTENFHEKLLQQISNANIQEPTKQSVVKTNLEIALCVGDHRWSAQEPKLIAVKDELATVQAGNEKAVAANIKHIFNSFAVYFEYDCHFRVVLGLVELLKIAFCKLPQLHNTFQFSSYTMIDLSSKHRNAIIAYMFEEGTFQSENFVYLYSLMFDTVEKANILSKTIGYLKAEKIVQLANIFQLYPENMQSFVLQAITRQNFNPVLRILLEKNMLKPNLIELSWKRCIEVGAFECCSTLFPLTSIFNNNEATEQLLAYAIEQRSVTLFEAIWPLIPYNAQAHYFLLERAKLLFDAPIEIKRAVATRCALLNDSTYVKNYLTSVYEISTSKVDPQTIASFYAEIDIFSSNLTEEYLNQVKAMLN